MQRVTSAKAMSALPGAQLQRRLRTHLQPTICLEPVFNPPSTHARPIFKRPSIRLRQHMPVQQHALPSARNQAMFLEATSTHASIHTHAHMHALPRTHAKHAAGTRACKLRATHDAINTTSARPWFTLNNTSRGNRHPINQPTVPPTPLPPGPGASYATRARATHVRSMLSAGLGEVALQRPDSRI
eukprot:361431-Chlamydomonas_euryale.AAC.6